MKPTKKDYGKLADIFGVSLDHCREVSVYGDDVFTVYRALRIAANLPSEEEIVAEIYKACGEEATLGNSAYTYLGHIAAYGVRRAFANALIEGEK